MNPFTHWLPFLQTTNCDIWSITYISSAKLYYISHCRAIISLNKSTKNYIHRTCYSEDRMHFFYKWKFFWSPTSGEDEFVNTLWYRSSQTESTTSICPQILRSANYNELCPFPIKYRKYKTHVGRSLTICPTAKCIYIHHGIYQIFTQLHKEIYNIFS